MQGGDGREREMGRERGESLILHFHLSVLFMQEAFLPQGYPGSVSDDYLAYQIWDTVQVYQQSYKCSNDVDIATP